MTIEYREMLAVLHAPPLSHLPPPGLPCDKQDDLTDPTSGGVMWSTAMDSILDESKESNVMWAASGTSNEGDLPDLSDIDLSHSKQLLEDEDEDLDFLLDTVVRQEVESNGDMSLSSPDSSTYEFIFPLSPEAAASGSQTPDGACPETEDSNQIPLTALAIASTNSVTKDANNNTNVMPKLSIDIISTPSPCGKYNTIMPVVQSTPLAPRQSAPKRNIHKPVLLTEPSVKKVKTSATSGPVRRGPGAPRPTRRIPAHLLSVQTCGQHNHNATRGRPVFCPSIAYPTIRQELDANHPDRVLPPVVVEIASRGCSEEEVVKKLNNIDGSDSKSECSGGASLDGFRMGSCGDSDVQSDYESGDGTESDEKTVERLERRRLNNRVAAQRCRQRKREHATVLKKEIQSWECDNTKLRYDIHLLNRELEYLSKVWTEHTEVCDDSAVAQSSSNNKASLKIKRKKKHRGRGRKPKQAKLTTENLNA